MFNIKDGEGAVGLYGVCVMNGHAKRKGRDFLCNPHKKGGFCCKCRWRAMVFDVLSCVWVTLVTSCSA